MHLRYVALIAWVLMGAASRLLPHPPNFAPVAAMALFAGAHFSDRRVALAVPLAAMLCSDLILGWHALLPLVYVAFALIVGLGVWIRPNRSMLRVAAGAVGGSILFFAMTNFGVWAVGSMYPKSLAGLAAAYVAAVPFFRNTLAGDLFYVALFFGGFALLERLAPRLREAPAAAQA